MPTSLTGATSTTVSICDERTPLLSPQVQDATATARATNRQPRAPTQIYWTRFWVLGMFCLFSCLSCWQWNTWGPISESVAGAYDDWGSSRVALMTNLATGIFVVCVWPVCWIVEKLGLRTSMLITCITTTGALAMRCTTQDPVIFTMLSTVSSCLLGVAMTMVMAVPPLIAVEWFDDKERVTAQAVMFAMEQLGLLVSYLEPLIVRLPGPGVTQQMLRNDITILMYIGTGCCVVLSLAIFLYFPSRPPMPPTRTAAMNRISLFSGVKMFIRKRELWVLTLCYFACTGPAFGWVTVLNYSLLPLGMHQDEAMYVGSAAILCSAFAAMAAGHYTDHNKGHLRQTLVLLLLLASGAFYWFLLLSDGVLSCSKWQIYASVIGGVAFNFACIPVFYEMAAELAYGCPEVVVGGMVASADNVSATFFLLVYQLPNIGFAWVPYVLVFSCASVVPAVLWINIDYRRRALDARARRPSESTNYGDTAGILPTTVMPPSDTASTGGAGELDRDSPATASGDTDALLVVSSTTDSPRQSKKSVQFC